MSGATQPPRDAAFTPPYSHGLGIAVVEDPEVLRVCQLSALRPGALPRMELNVPKPRLEPVAVLEGECRHDVAFRCWYTPFSTPESQTNTNGS